MKCKKNKMKASFENTKEHKRKTKNRKNLGVNHFLEGPNLVEQRRFYSCFFSAAAATEAAANGVFPVSAAAAAVSTGLNPLVLQVFFHEFSGR